MEDLSKKNIFPYCHNFTANTDLTQITLPDNAKTVNIGSEDQKLFFVVNGGTDGGSIPTNKGFIPKNNYFQIKMGRGYNRTNDIFVASRGGTAEVSIIMFEE